ncbi:cation-translocating P-type ATPase [uncultured Paracoccus sp.]|uniref:cation-translocating P-type ATPase n=1 Tax=uncultured Paracoccus sp. TaxID=189685 RepID=UPI0026065ED3|nr:cation-translocating P-type ATPase [uncultured Paracoccus sp.]
MTTEEPATTTPDPYRRAADDVLRDLGVIPETGLTAAEADARLATSGRNTLATRPPVPGWRRFLGQFTDRLVLLLIAAATVSLVLWLIERTSALPYEALAILAIVLFNAVMSHVQQARAEQSLEALSRMAAPRASVLRDGTRQAVPADHVVPGDIILIEEGDTIPADARLIDAAGLHLAEAALTGESVPVAKDPAPITAEAAVGDRRNMVFSGTSVTRGHGTAVVTATGMQTQMGQIAGLLDKASDEATPLQRELDRVGRRLGLIVIGIAVVIVAAIALTTEVRGLSGLFDILILGVALAVAAVPEGLPAIVTAVLALGVQRMARRNAIVRQLAAVETLGSADVICSDKTGTLTRNEMTVRRVVTASGTMLLAGNGYDPDGRVTLQGGDDDLLRADAERVLIAASLASNATLVDRDGVWTIQGDPTEGALIAAAGKAGLDPDRLAARYPRVDEIPFSSERKLMSTVHDDAEGDGARRLFTKGAPDMLLDRCGHELVAGRPTPLTEDRRAEIRQASETLAAGALRTLAVAERRLPPDGPADETREHDMVLLGLIGMIDPPRSEAADAVARARAAGIRPIMITGDHPATALVIARELGIDQDDEAITGTRIESMSDEALDAAVRDVSVYARVDPAHKLRLVAALQRQGATVAMTGDGVNDAPALKAADIGIAMGITGTDVSRQAADIVLADDNFASIVAAVEEGRVIFANIRKFLRYLLSSNVGEVMTMFLGVLLAGTLGLSDPDGALILPLLATQILWINLVTDGAPALALGIDPAARDVMRQAPRARTDGIVTRRMWAGIIFVGLVMAIGTLGVLDAALPGGMIGGQGSTRYGQTMAFTTLTLFQLFNVFNARSDDRSALGEVFASRWLWAAVAVSLGLHVAVVHVPPLQQAFSTVALGWADWLICGAVASSVLWLREIEKLVARRLASRPAQPAPA